MEISSEIKAFVKEPHYMVLSTLTQSNTIQMSIVWYEFENGVFKISTTIERAKYNNLHRNPHASCLIYDAKNPYKYIVVTGTVSFTKKGGHDFIDYLSKRYTGQSTYAGDPDRKQNRVVGTITPTKIISFGM